MIYKIKQHGALFQVGYDSVSTFSYDVSVGMCAYETVHEQKKKFVIDHTFDDEEKAVKHRDLLNEKLMKS